MVRRRPPISLSRLTATVLGLLVAVGTLPLLIPVLPASSNLHEGELAPNTIEAQRDAQYESAVLTEAQRTAAAQGVEPVYLSPDTAIQLQQGEALARLIDQVRFVRGRSDLSAQQQLDELKSLSVTSALSEAAQANLLFLDRIGYESVASAAQRALSEILRDGVKEGTASLEVRQYLTEAPGLPAAPAEMTALTDLLNGFVVTNVQVDQAATEERRQAAREAVAPVIVTYSRGQVVLREGETIGSDDIEALRETGVIEAGFNEYDALAGGIVAAGLGLVLGYFAYSLQPFGRPAWRRTVLTAATIVAAMVAVRLVLPQVLPDTEGRYLAYAIPVATAPMIATAAGNVGYGAVVALALGFAVSFTGATVSELAGAEYIGPMESLQIAAVYGLGGLAGAACLADAERLGRSIVAATAVAIATAVTLVAFWLVSPPRDTAELGWIAIVSIVNGAASGVLTTGLFLLLALALGVPTRFQLFELAQSDHPLLRRLLEEAPGTYHHSLMVGTLAERAADNIGADPLLARVGAYYHDVGKLTRPGFFVENLVDVDESPHRELSPQESAAIIRSHVTDGIELARKARLPAVVREFIPQHHGTRLVTFFYRQASRDGNEVDPRDFRYPGPRPTARETAIVMLADSCEAVVRAVNDRSARRIEELVDSVFAERLAEGQFDDCDITLKELQLVARSFKATLRAVYHPRIEYPSPGPEELAAAASGR